MSAGFDGLPSEGDFSDTEMPISAIPNKIREKRKKGGGNKKKVSGADNFTVGRENYRKDLRQKLAEKGIVVDDKWQIVGSPKFIYTTESGGQAEVEIQDLNMAGGCSLRNVKSGKTKETNILFVLDRLEIVNKK